MADTLSLADARPPRLVRPSGTSLELLGCSAAATRAQDFVRRASPLATGILLVAEPGIDAESVARAIHTRGRPPGAPFVQVDCHADNPASLEQALLGPAADADAPVESIDRASQLAAALGGTLFLRDVTELPSAAQARLARIARDGEVRLDRDFHPFDVRLVASAPPSVDVDVREHRVRIDLFRRLSASRIDLPALRDRPEDLPLLAARVLEETCVAQGVARRTLTQAASALLGALTWPGNLAELRDVLAGIARNSSGPTVQVEELLPVLKLNRTSSEFVPSGTLRDVRQRFERDYIAAVLQHHAWRVAEAAHTLGIQRPNLYRKARQLGIPLARVSD